MMPKAKVSKRRIDRERLELLQRLENWLETPMLLLSFVWLALRVLELTGNERPILGTLSTAIWAVFIVDFAVKLTLAPQKMTYLRRNWLTAIALLVPAFRVFRVARVLRLLRYARAVRGLRLFRVVTSLNRGTRALGSTLSSHGFGYVVLMTLLVTFAGAAGMVAFESGPEGGQLDSYGTALWWTAMIMTTMGSEVWPKSLEGRLLCLALATYAFAVFGYVTAKIASYLVDSDAASGKAAIAGQQSIDALHAEVQQLRADLKSMVARIEEQRRL
jgi:voltage-gated potassium channel